MMPPPTSAIDPSRANGDRAPCDDGVERTTYLTLALFESLQPPATNRLSCIVSYTVQPDCYSHLPPSILRPSP